MPEPTAPDCLTLVIECEERRAALRDALRSMSPLEQQVLLRRVCAAQPFATIARCLGLGPADVRSLFSSAYARLDAIDADAVTQQAPGPLCADRPRGAATDPSSSLDILASPSARLIA